MRFRGSLCALMIVCCIGCNHVALQRHTINQASTLTDLQYQQTLDNLAMFACNPDAMAWHFKLEGGTIQVADQGSAELGAEFAHGVAAIFTPRFAGQRGIVGQWDGVPAVEADELELLQLAYRMALSPGDGETTRTIWEKVCELSIAYNILLSQETVDQMIAWMKPRANEIQSTEQFAARKFELQRRHAELQRKLEDERRNLTKLGVPKPPPKTTTGVWDNITTFSERLAENEDRKAQAVVVSATEDQIVNVYREICEQPVIPRYPGTSGRAEHNIHEVQQVQEKIKKLTDLAEAKIFPQPWVHVSKKKRDVPRCACYVGHYKDCCGDCYVWVLPEQRRLLRELTLTVLTLAPLEQQDMAFPSGQAGVIFSPSLR